jgi:AraC family transcriptional regulator
MGGTGGNPVGKALWFIEHRIGDDIQLAEIAQFCGVSRFHLTRAFGTLTGRSVISYLRGRRLSEAAKRLASGAPDILTVALDAGYGSHEAFTRAFRDQFGLTPDVFRGCCVNDIALVESFQMTTETVDLEPPRYETGPVLLIAGLGGRFRFETNQTIPQLWQRFTPYLGTIPNQRGGTTYGVCCNADGAGNFDYIAGIEVASFDDLPAEFARLRLAARRYAVFTHRGHISTLRGTVQAIWNTWLPASGHTVADAPDFERYDEAFRPPNGDVEIWLPIEPR